jgi:hypothetical protein
VLPPLHGNGMSADLALTSAASSAAMRHALAQSGFAAVETLSA